MSSVWIKELAAGFLSGGSFLLFYNVLGVGLEASLLVCVGVFAGLWLAVPRSQIEWQLEKMGVSTAYVQATLHEGEAKLAAIKKLAGRIEDVRVEGIVQALEALFANLRKYPARVRSVSRVFSIFLDMTITLFTEYAELHDEQLSDGKHQQTLQKTQESFALLEDAFKKANEKVLAQNFSTLETEAELLKKIIMHEGV